MKILHVIGCGKVGRTLARLASQSGLWQIGCVLNRSRDSAAGAVEFIGAGRAVQCYAELPLADLVMISASDRAIETCCRQLVEAGKVTPGMVLFHCSGALPSAVLEPARACGARIASVHPVKSFADPIRAVETFPGTFCAMEGDAAACELLVEAVERLGGDSFTIDPEAKTVYHAATVIVCNYLASLLEAGLRCFERAGVPRETATKVMGPIVRETVANVLELGPVDALTGPIARGEVDVVAQQCRALSDFSSPIEDIYKALGRMAVELSTAQGSAPEESLATIRETLRRR